MLSRLANLLGGLGRKSTYPSVILVLGGPSTTVYALHIVPEDHVAEQFGYSCTGETTIKYKGATEVSRELLGSVLLHVGDGERARDFLEEVSAQATKLIKKGETSDIEEDRVPAIAQTLRSTGLQSLQAREERQPPKNAAQQFPVFLVYIDRTRPGKLVTDSDPTSIESHTLPVTIWRALPDMPQLTGPTIPDFERRFFLQSPSTILKLRTEEGEGAMTQFAHDILGPVAPALHAMIEITGPPPERGLLLSRQPGTLLVELWPNLSVEARTKVKTSLVELLVRMRNPLKTPDYYGRPGERSYVTLSELSGSTSHAYCRNCDEWNMSRVKALKSSAEDIDLKSDRLLELESIQYSIVIDEATLVVLPVLTHGDLSDRNILVSPDTLQVTGLIDWEMAAVTPAYFEYAAARLCGGHDAAWRQVLLEVLRDVLRIECERRVSGSEPNSRVECASSEQLFRETLQSWNFLVDVERAAQGYSDDCYWTFEDGAAELGGQ